MTLPLVFINLDRDEDRRTRMAEQLRRSGMPGRRLTAVWWADQTEARQAAWYSAGLNGRQYYKPLLAGEKGCYASHLQAWESLLDSHASAMVVLEDDVRLEFGFAEAVRAIEALDEPWDMVKLIGRDQEKVRSSRALTGGLRLVQYRRVPSTTAGYVVSRSGAQKLLASRRPFGRPVDVDLRFWWENDLRILGVTPAVLSLDSTSDVSTIWQQIDHLSPAARWRKFRMKWQLNLGNLRHGRRHPPLA
ncbi:glycosyl transferase family 25 [Xylophilus sp. Kf1]|nr:glycosyl transferase family 25 [Xylophilus sp. Kf1]